MVDMGALSVVDNMLFFVYHFGVNNLFIFWRISRCLIRGSCPRSKCARMNIKLIVSKLAQINGRNVFDLGRSIVVSVVLVG